MASPERISIQGGRLIDPAHGIDRATDLHLAAGRVLAIGTAPADFQPERVIDARERIVCPGFIDLSARLREPGLEQKATIESETRAAAASGITTLCCPPDTCPVIDTPAVAQLIQQTAQRHGFARVIPAGAMTQGLEGQQITEMAALQLAGCRVLSQADQPIRNALVQRRAMEYAATFGLTLFLRPQDPDLSRGGCAHEGRVSTRLGLPGIPEAAETVAIARDLALAGQTGARVHFRGLSTARAIAILLAARRRGVSASADVSMHQLFLTEDDLDGFDANCHLIPPPRTRTDRDALRQALAAGELAAVCSDHQPHDADAKLLPFPETAPGLSGLETLLPLALRLVRAGVMDLSSILARLTTGPAGILGCDLGHLAPGAPADVCIFDPTAAWIPTPETIRSHGQNSPFLGTEMLGRVDRTLLAGRVVFERNGADSSGPPNSPPPAPRTG
ncbi:dihydroorotase [Thiocapsa imhoffii]|uniref:Dihydroorotase n=1 Tax=Thiocapsa imhoffii TaxID=382777 RepID=A0A9X0WGR7_9GAMM|nr:dihydroorotase [Thiocapsa imhoffii]MBK1644231.1 dihydroorotase [Thiocapsa imhoffii]